ncbi:MAG: hypothetical protein RQ751_14145, partial [Longimicrobiales bacterium]|nr:hypothetical protein [Longimicrobiales bacterium]
QVAVAPVVPGTWDARAGSGAERSARVRARIVEARARQRRRFGVGGPGSNAEMGPGLLVRWARPAPAAVRLVRDAEVRLALSPRGVHRLLKVARTLADLDGASKVEERHAAEAIHFRELDLPVD